jgi:shikimate kinase
MSTSLPEQKIILIGAMGAGKTTLGKILSRELNWPYIDNDGEIGRRRVGKECRSRWSPYH